MKKIVALSDESLRRFTARASVIAASILILAKLFAYLATGSLALLSTLIDSGVDLLASLLTAFGVVTATAPPDRDHRFGHGKAEPLVALAQAAFILGSTVFLAFESFDRLLDPMPPTTAIAGYVVMVVAIVTTLALLALQGYTIKRTGSLAIAADRMHYVGDILVNGAVILSLFLSDLLGIFWIDPLCALLIAALMLRGALGIGRKALGALMDAELSAADRAAILEVALQTDGVMGAHDLRTRTDGERIFIELHVEMDGAQSLFKAHEVVEKVIASVTKIYPQADIIIHQDPAGLEEDRLDARIEPAALSPAGRKDV